MFALPHFVVIFLVISQVPLSYGFIPRPGQSPRRLPFPIAQPTCNSRYVVIPQFIPPSGSIFANDPRVTLFTNAFLDRVYSRSILRSAFDLSQTTAKQYGDFVREYTENVLSSQGMKNAAALAEWASRCIAPNFDILTLPIVSRAYCNMVANLLAVEGEMTIDNAERLGFRMAQTIEESAKVTMTSDPTSKFPSLANGYSVFLLSVVEYSSIEEKNDKAALAAYYVGNEWCVAAVNYRWW